jgi:hypothetical protein
MLWFQGWNDKLTWQMVRQLLKNLIRSMRLDLDAPDLPMVIGELGQHDPNPTGLGHDRVMPGHASS